MPADVVVWNTSSIELRSARTGRLVRTLAPAGMFCCDESISVSHGTVYFEADLARRYWVESVPLRGGHISKVTEGQFPAVSPDGRLLAYVNYPTSTRGPAIVVRNLRTGTSRSWGFASFAHGIDCCLSWSPDDAVVYFQEAGPTLGPDATHALDIRSGGSLDRAPRLGMGSGLHLAAVLGPRTALAVQSTGTGTLGRSGREELVTISLPGGQVMRRLLVVPGGGIAVSNSFDGTEGTVAADSSGRYLLISCLGPGGYGELYRWAAGTGKPVPIASGVFGAAWS
jgi:hypothetical protein